MAKRTKCKGTRAQHRELDAEYRALLLPYSNPMAYWVNQSVMALWGQEKHYLSQYGRRWRQDLRTLVRKMLPDG